VFNTHGTAPNFAFDVHFWLGEGTTQDEAGTAAYKTVELDDFHKGVPVQHREVQGYESDLFASYFPKGIRILHGGIESGFRHVTPENYQPRLFHVRGGFRDVRINQVALARDSLNSGDVFVLDAGLKIYQWNGSSSGGMERMKAGQFCRALDDERSGRPEVVVFDEGNGNEQFWSLLGGQGPIKSAEEGNKQTAPASRKVLYKLSDASGSLTFTEVGKGSVRKNLLDSNDAFIFDAGTHVYIWVGKHASPNEKRNALGYATKYLTEHGLPLHTPITRIPEGSHNAAFDSGFDH